MTTPADYNLPHDEWRKYQYETVQSLLDNAHSHQIHLLESAVGSGKSAYIAALGSQGRTAMALVRTHALQDQYRELYDFRVLKGMNAYPCDYNPILHADSCAFLGEGMYSCPVSQKCQYLLSRKIFQESERRVTNYNYFLLSDWQRQHAPNWIGGDECHRLPEILEDHLSLELSVENCYDFDIPVFPTIRGVKVQMIRRKKILEWIDKALVNLHYNKVKLERMAQNRPNILRKVRRMESIIYKFDTVQRGLSEDPDNWHVWWSGTDLKIVPLSIAPYFKEHFIDGFASNFLFMSATVGDPNIYASIIGIDSYFYHHIPSVFSAEERAVHVLKNVPSMNYRATTKEKDLQADEIAKAINSCNPDWPFLIHTTSYKKQEELGNRLARRGLQDRLFSPEGKSTGDKLQSAKTAVEKFGNPITISVVLEEGVSLPQYRGNIVASLPWPYLGNEIGRKKMEHNKAHYRWKTGVGTRQMLGRNRRGIPSHYGDNSFNAIADGGINYIMDSLSAEFKESLVDWS